MTIGVTMNYCLILSQSSELVLCTASIILIMPCNGLMLRTLSNVWTLWLKDMLKVWCILTIFDLYCLRQVLVKPTQTWTTESAKNLANFSNYSYLQNELRQNWFWVLIGVTASRVAPRRLARLCVVVHLSNKSRAKCLGALGATQHWVGPGGLARLMKQSRQWAPKTSFVVVHFADKSSSRN
jgi:hypothetical protein